MSHPARPEFDPELKAGLAIVGGVFPPTITRDLIPFMRRSYASPPVREILAGRDVDHRDYEIEGHGGDAVTVAVLSSRQATGRRPAVAFDIFAPHTALARGMLRERFAWVERLLAD